MQERRILTTRLITLVSVIAALDIVLAALPLIPYGPSAGALVKPSEGILLGPWGGMLAAFVGGIISSIIWPSTAVLGLATWIPGVIGAFGAGMLLKGRWKAVLVLFAAILIAFFLHPFGSGVFLYADWDKLVALCMIIPVSLLVRRQLRQPGSRESVKALAPVIGLVSLIATEMDGATGNLIFLLEAEPMFGLKKEMLPALFIPYTFLDPATRVLIGIVCALVLTPVLVAAERANLLKWPLT
ncbi:MAG: hypothetical protein ABSA81_06720 [Candidatus Bathyarchaeia archaeon]|jgi:hypothetical protein